MAHSLSAQKRVRQTETLNARNRWRKGTMRDSLKDCLEKIMHGTPEEAQKAFQEASQIIDRTAQKGVIHKNQAARRKSRLSARLQAKFGPNAKAAAAPTGKSGKAAAKPAAKKAK